VASAVLTVLARAGEPRARDIHAAVEAVLNEDVSPSSVKNCLATYSRTADPCSSEWDEADTGWLDWMGRARRRRRCSDFVLELLNRGKCRRRPGAPGEHAGASSLGSLTLTGV
jgi:hypothetical protein